MPQTIDRMRALDVHPFPPSLENLLPPAAQEANAALIAATTKAAEVQTAARAATEAVRGAQAADKAAAQEAAEAGKKPPAATAPRAEQASADADRAAEAHAAVARQRQYELLEAVRSALGPITAAAEGELDTVGTAAAAHFDAIADALRRTGELRTLLGELDPAGLEGREVSFVPGPRGKRAQAGALPGEVAAALEGLRGRLAPRRWKIESELTADERAQVDDARSRGQRSPSFEREAYREFIGAEA
jgi:hypothetical protein